MGERNRREFLADVGRGMLVAGVGSAFASELGIMQAFAADADGDLDFGKLEPLVAMMQETPLRRLQATLIEKMADGTPLRTLVAAGALANARSFGGQDYVGYHALMAMLPALEMSKQLPKSHQALPILKVLYRNTDKIQKNGGRPREVLKRVAPKDIPDGTPGAKLLREAMTKCDMHGAEQVFAKLASQNVEDAYNDLLHIVQDDINVHRVVLAWRSWDILNLVGMENAHTMLRQSVRFCVHEEQSHRNNGRSPSGIRKLLPQLLDEHGLLGRAAGTRKGDDAWITELSEAIFAGSRADAAKATAHAIAEGFDTESVGEAISLAANRLLLEDPGRDRREAVDKPKGSVHGASVGVHAQDAANAWRHIARVSNDRNAIASLIVGAYHTAGQRQRIRNRGGIFPFAELAADMKNADAATMLDASRTAVEAGDQARICGLVDRYGQLGHDPKPLFDLMLRYAVSEDGALHAEKYFRTIQEEYRDTRPSMRWRHMIALGRVTASEYGRPAPGRDEARRLLGITA